MKYYIYSLISLAAMVLTGCGSDDVLPGPSETDRWLHPYGASAFDQELQIDFYDHNGIYLLFNDTLFKNQVSTYPDGSPFFEMETVNLTYYMTGLSTSNNEIFSYDYFTSDIEKQKATAFVQDKLLPHLSGNLLPFSMLLVNKINLWSRQYASYPLTLSNPIVYAGYRCTAISAKGVADMDDAQQTAYCNQILQAVVNSKLSALPADTFDEFYSFTLPYYSTYAMYDAAVAFFAEHPKPMDIGLLDNGVSYYRWSPEGSLIMYNIAAKNYDLQDYTTAVFTYSDAAFADKYGQYPIVMSKFKILKQIYESVGVKF